MHSHRSPLAVSFALLLVGLGTAVPTSAAAATSDARYIATYACPPHEIEERFTDTALNAHGFAIDCLATYGFTGGTSPTTYSPAGIVTRGQMATFLYNVLTAAGVTMDTADQGYADVAGTQHERQINGITSVRIAYGNDSTFLPNAPITRGQLASFLARTIVTTGAFMDVGPDAFDDDNGSVHETSIDALAHNGITTGTTERRFEPDGLVRRDATASFLMRATDFAIENGGMRSPFSANHRIAEMTPGQVVTEGGGEPDAAGSAELWTIAQHDVLCFSISTTGIGSGTDHPERSAYLSAGAPGQVGEILVELPPPSAANDLPPGADAASAGCVRTDETVVDRLIGDPESLYVGLATFEYEEALRGQLSAPD